MNQELLTLIERNIHDGAEYGRGFLEDAFLSPIAEPGCRIACADAPVDVDGWFLNRGYLLEWDKASGNATAIAITTDGVQAIRAKQRPVDRAYDEKLAAHFEGNRRRMRNFINTGSIGDI